MGVRGILVFSHCAAENSDGRHPSETFPEIPSDRLTNTSLDKEKSFAKYHEEYAANIPQKRVLTGGITKRSMPLHSSLPHFPLSETLPNLSCVMEVIKEHATSMGLKGTTAAAARALALAMEVFLSFVN